MSVINAPFDAILRAARKAEAEGEHYKDTNTAPTKAAQPQGINAELMNELAVINGVFAMAVEDQTTS